MVVLSFKKIHAFQNVQLTDTSMKQSSAVNFAIQPVYPVPAQQATVLAVVLATTYSCIRLSA